MNEAIPFTAAGACVAAPLLAAGALAMPGGERNPRLHAVVGLAMTLIAAVVLAGWQHRAAASPLAWGLELAGGRVVVVDGLTAILLPYVAIVGLAVAVAAPRRVLDGPVAARMLVSIAATMALMLTAHPVVLVVLWTVTAIPTWIATRSVSGGRPVARVYALAMILSTACIAAGTALMVIDPPWLPDRGEAGVAGGWLVAVAVMIRKGIVPFHSWYPALFSAAPFSAALTATMPQVASYTAIRLLVGHAEGVAPELVVLSQAAFVTAAYGASLALVQRDVRGLVGTLAMSQSALVLAGLAGTLPLELCGALAIWISSGLALTGIGLVAWSLESRSGSVRLEEFGGRHGSAPGLAAFFLLFGLASLGLPGTFSFVADDLIVAGSLSDDLHAGVLVIVATALAGIAMMRGWFRIFGGQAKSHGPRQPILLREQVAFLGLLAILFGLGLSPGPAVNALERVATDLLAMSHLSSTVTPPGGHP